MDDSKVSFYIVSRIIGNFGDVKWGLLNER